MPSSSAPAPRRLAKDERAKYRTLRRDPRTGVYRETRLSGQLLTSRPKDRTLIRQRRRSAAAHSTARPVSVRPRMQAPAPAALAAPAMHRALPPRSQAERADRDRARRRTSPALRRGGRPTDASRKCRQSLRADCRCTFPSPPRWRPAIRRGPRSCAGPRSSRRDSSSAPPRRHRREIRANAKAQDAPRPKEARRARSARPRE